MIQYRVHYSTIRNIDYYQKKIKKKKRVKFFKNNIFNPTLR